MIGRLKGVVARKTWPTVLLDVNGVGYELQVPLSAYDSLPSPGSGATLEVLTVVRSESLQLYGFADRDERLLFETLIGVSGVGPRLALAVLSGVSVSTLAAAVRNEDSGALESIPGIGRKTAHRLLIELKDKLDALDVAAVPSASSDDSVRGGLPADAVAALENLGYRKPEAEKAVMAALGSGGADDLAELIRGSLRRLRDHA